MQGYFHSGILVLFVVYNRELFLKGFRLKNGHTLMLFRDIFDMYQNISNKVVGILARARKNKLVHFEGETLFQG